MVQTNRNSTEGHINRQDLRFKFNKFIGAPVSTTESSTVSWLSSGFREDMVNSFYKDVPNG